MGDANGSIVHDKPKVRDMYLNTKYKMDKYPYLYEGMNTIEEFRPYYCPMEILHEGLFLHCDDLESIDNGTLAERFTNFVMDYSGLDPFDIQLRIWLVIIVGFWLLLLFLLLLLLLLLSLRFKYHAFVLTVCHVLSSFCIWLIVRQQFDASGSQYSLPIR